MVFPLALMLVGLATPIYGYPDGAPLDACISMFPHHDGMDSQTESSPYTITVNTASYRKGENVTVTISTNDKTKFFFEGFFLQARRADCSNAGKPIGRFYLTSDALEVKVINCPGKHTGNAVTHTTNAHRDSKTFIWNNPDGMDVFFQATVINHKNTFWSNLQSQVVQDADMGKMGMKYDACPGQTTYTGKTNGTTRRVVSAWVLLGLVAFIVDRVL